MPASIRGTTARDGRRSEEYALIGTWIKALREEHDLSQEDLARLLGFNDRQTVSAIRIDETELRGSINAVHSVSEPERETLAPDTIQE